MLGGREECLATGMHVADLNWIGFDPPASGSFRAEVQVRYHHAPAGCEVELSAEGARVRFDDPQLAITAGQGAAFYRDDLLLGGGWIAGGEPVLDGGAERSVGAR